MSLSNLLTNVSTTYTWSVCARVATILSLTVLLLKYRVVLLQIPHDQYQGTCFGSSGQFELRTNERLPAFELRKQEDVRWSTLIEFLRCLTDVMMKHRALTALSDARALLGRTAWFLMFCVYDIV